jgi:hypothetical protein
LNPGMIIANFERANGNWLSTRRRMSRFKMRELTKDISQKGDT